MDETQLRLDGNAASGTLGEIFVHDLSAARGKCSSCGKIAQIGSQHLYMYPRSPGAVLRCSTCEDVLMVIANTAGRYRFGLQGLVWLETSDLVETTAPGGTWSRIGTLSPSRADSAAARIAFLRGLRAVRQLRPDSLPEAVLHDILEVARWSGSAGNRQPWEFVVVRDRQMLGRLATIEGANAAHLASAAVGLAIVIRPEVSDLDAYDEGRLAERILLAAAAHGVGAAVGHFTGPGDTWAASADAKRLLGIPEERVLRETISLGYPAEHLERTPNPPGRKPLDELVHWDRY